jgi:hypothetical protein
VQQAAKNASPDKAPIQTVRTTFFIIMKCYNAAKITIKFEARFLQLYFFVGIKKSAIFAAEMKRENKIK